jgi:pSer/pThr/pTyr-binding forkhead associated (FHA) protein
MQSSSGTFLNNRRLCAANQMSQPFQLHDNDIIQLGVDYQGGTQGKNKLLLFCVYSLIIHLEIYRCVKMRLELDKNQQKADNMNKYK